ncbi:MAG: DoxX family protein [Myxococcota bacterium]
MESSTANLAWAALRVVFGLSMAFFHGYSKVFEGGAAKLLGAVNALGIPFPTFFAWAAALSEFAGGLLLALGLATRPAAAFIGCTMLVALYHHTADPFARSEVALLYFTVAGAAVVLGGGRFALDRFIRLRLPLQARGAGG